MIGALIAAVTIGLIVYTRSQPNLNNVDEVMTLVGRHVVLPQDERPALVTVTDPTKVSTEFLKNTQTGDKILIYQTNQKAVIYRPSIDRIVTIGPVVIEAPKATNGE